MRALLKKILFKGKKPKTFPALRILTDHVNEKVFLAAGNNEIEITNLHSIVCHDPFQMAVCLRSQELSGDSLHVLKVKVGNKTVARAEVNFLQRIEITGSTIGIYEITGARAFQVDSLRQFFLYRYFKNKDTILQGKIYSTLYSYPRRVILVSYQEQGYYNIFPMDFQCFIAESNFYILGLRTTNITLEKILRTGKVVIADTDNAPLGTLYYLGRHHKNPPATIQDLPFGVIESELHKFPVPDFVSAYKEIEIIKSQKLGTHMLMIGKVINAKELRRGNSSIYHIHFFHSFASNYPEA